jgi:hypothetical protein
MTTQCEVSINKSKGYLGLGYEDGEVDGTGEYRRCTNDATRVVEPFPETIKPIAVCDDEQHFKFAYARCTQADPRYGYGSWAEEWGKV